MEATLLRGDETCQHEDSGKKAPQSLQSLLIRRIVSPGTVLLAPVELLSIGTGRLTCNPHQPRLEYDGHRDR
jgi:hypothetical protein